MHIFFFQLPQWIDLRVQFVGLLLLLLFFLMQPSEEFVSPPYP